jgi:glutaredoxin
MEKIYYFYRNDSAYCHQTEEALNMIRFEHPEYSRLEVERVDTETQKRMVHDFGCTDAPQIFNGDKKLLYEAAEGDTYRMTKKKLEDLFLNLN